MGNKDNNSSDLILGLGVIGCLTTGTAGIILAFMDVFVETNLGGGPGLIGSAIAFGSVLFFFKKKQ